MALSTLRATAALAASAELSALRAGVAAVAEPELSLVLIGVDAAQPDLKRSRTVYKNLAAVAPASPPRRTDVPEGMSHFQAFMDGHMIGSGVGLLTHIFTFLGPTETVKLRSVTRELKRVIDTESSVDFVFQSRVKAPDYEIGAMEDPPRDIKSVHNWHTAVPPIFPPGCHSFRTFMVYNKAVRAAARYQAVNGANQALIQRHNADNRAANRLHQQNEMLADQLERALAVSEERREAIDELRDEREEQARRIDQLMLENDRLRIILDVNSPPAGERRPVRELPPAVERAVLLAGAFRPLFDMSAGSTTVDDNSAVEISAIESADDIDDFSEDELDAEERLEILRQNLLRDAPRDDDIVDDESESVDSADAEERDLERAGAVDAAEVEDQDPYDRHHDHMEFDRRMGY